MRRIYAGVLLIWLFCLVASAQEINGFRNHGYTFGGLGKASGESATNAHFGVGATGQIKGNFGLNAEIGYIYCAQCGISNGAGLLSLNGSYHFPSAKNPRLAPFVTAGYSLGFRGGVANMANLGGGIDYWFRPRLGVKVEFRDHLYPRGGAPTHIWEARLGLAIR